eukprot:TRINITY_DN9712_c0_g1_i1.p1 TRINITY_DN9712_c0_g1~~TRINITY_DN9712_c0_g1_i1.p1  ORF type:complete len:508 (+),score=85.79 TRINITY_DN9712_c0_g1_i1:143-1666(+)
MPAIVLIHGLFGWGEERPLYGLGPTYFPIQQLRRLWQGGPVLAVDVGVASSDHDRACEAFAQLLGARVDYGVQHSCEFGHERFGTDYSLVGGLLERWDAEHPVHLVGHSFGGTTAVTLFNLIAEDYWRLGTGPQWVLSVSCICSPLRGCSLPLALGFDVHDEAAVRPLLKRAVTAVGVMAGKAQMMFPWLLKPLFDLRVDQFRDQTTWQSILTADHPWVNDNMMLDSTPRLTRDLWARGGGHDHKQSTFLIAVVADSLPPLAPAAAVRAAAPYAGAAATCWWLSAYLCWRYRQILQDRLRRFAQRRSVRRGVLLLLVWTLLSPFLAVPLLTAPQLRRFRSLLGAQLQVALEPFRPILHGWVARPLLRLCSHAVQSANATLVSGSPSDETGISGENDGFIDLTSQRGLGLTTQRPRRKRSMKGVESRESLASAHESALAQSFSQEDATGELREVQKTEPLQKGTWRIIHVAGADHCLGTWLDHRHTNTMYSTVFSLLERCEQDIRGFE